MPISCPITARHIEQEEFARHDFQVMRLAFDSQNALGRLCDEVIYQNDLADRIEAAGLGPVRREVPLIITHRDFAKTYSMDLVVGDAAIYELKALANLVAEHDAQLLNYLLLWGAHHGKLLNFRPTQVQSRFINTTLTPQSRKLFEVESDRWHPSDGASQLLHSTFLGLLEDWGLFLELPLYLEALTHFLGGQEQVVRMVPLKRGSVSLGNQRLYMLTPDIAFRLTAMPDTAEHYERQLCSLLRHSQLRACHWVNMARHKVQFVTLQT